MTGKIEGRVIHGSISSCALQAGCPKLEGLSLSNLLLNSTPIAKTKVKVQYGFSPWSSLLYILFVWFFFLCLFVCFLRLSLLWSAVVRRTWWKRYWSWKPNRECVRNYYLSQLFLIDNVPAVRGHSNTQKLFTSVFGCGWPWGK